MKTQSEVIRQVLVEYLSIQPDRTAMNRDCHRAVAEALGWKANEAVVRRCAQHLGITRYGGSLKEPGQTFITWWVLPEELSTQVTATDRDKAQALADAVARGDDAEVGTSLEYGVRRPRQVLMALAELAAEVEQ